ncbi:MAG: hypothetical protein WCR06_05665 [bacterium]
MRDKAPMRRASPHGLFLKRHIGGFHHEDSRSRTLEITETVGFIELRALRVLRGENSQQLQEKTMGGQRVAKKAVLTTPVFFRIIVAFFTYWVVWPCAQHFT